MKHFEIRKHSFHTQLTIFSVSSSCHGRRWKVVRTPATNIQLTIYPISADIRFWSCLRVEKLLTESLNGTEQENPKWISSSHKMRSFKAFFDRPKPKWCTRRQFESDEIQQQHFLKIYNIFAFVRFWVSSNAIWSDAIVVVAISFVFVLLCFRFSFLFLFFVVRCHLSTLFTVVSTIIICLHKDKTNDTRTHNTMD